MASVAQRTGCDVLCDINNIYVSAMNHGWDASAYLAALPARRIGEIHLAGHALREIDDGRVIRIDDHGSRVPHAVWRLYMEALGRFGPVPTLIEWDNEVPPLDVLLAEARQAAGLLHTFASQQRPQRFGTSNMSPPGDAMTTSRRRHSRCTNCNVPWRAALSLATTTEQQR